MHYLEEKDAVLCHTCARANSEGKLQRSSNADPSFVAKGFTNWKDATVKFGLHDSNKCRKEAVLKILTLPSTTVSVADMLSEQSKREKLDRRHCFLRVLTSLKFLARQGLALRVHGDESDSNFIQLLKLLSVNDERMCVWLNKKTDKYTAPDMQNEMVKVMDLHVL